MEDLLVIRIIGILVCIQGVSSTMTGSCQVTADPASTSQTVTGTVTFTQESSMSDVSVTIALTGFSTSDGEDSHGFHVHETGNITGGCSSAGGHYNPHGVTHGSRTDTTRHVGDLGNIVESSGAVSTSFTDSVISLHGTYSIIGRGLVIHATADDYSSSSSSGNAGSRVACCVINDGATLLANISVLLICLICAVIRAH